MALRLSPKSFQGRITENASIASMGQSLVDVLNASSAVILTPGWLFMSSHENILSGSIGEAMAEIQAF